MPKRKSTFDFHLFDKFAESLFTQTKDLTIEGRIESCEPSIFTKDPAVDVSVMCFDPDFVDPVAVTFDGMTITDLNDMLLQYDGNVDTGVVFKLFPDRDISDFTIFHQPPDGSLVTIDFSYPLIADDVLEISSVRGSKYVKVTRAGIETSILYAISPQSGWLELQPGDNGIRVYATDTPIYYSIDYTNKYGGL
jgi:hypothetical protein